MTRHNKSKTNGTLKSPPRFAFTTEDFPARDRFKAFCDFTLSRTAMNFSTNSPLDFCATFEIQPLGSIDIFEIKKTSHLLATVFPAQAQRADDRVTLQICNQGTIRGSHGNSQREVGSGGALLIHANLLGEVEYEAETSLHSIFIDKSRLRPLLKDDLQNDVRALPPETSALRLLSLWLRALTAADISMDAGLKAVIEGHTLDLVVLALGARDDAREQAEMRSGKSARLHAIIDLIARNATQANLTAEHVGCQLGITGRYVRRLLEETGQTFSDHMFEQRLQRAWKLLVDPRFESRKVAEIALMAGFGDLSGFNRAFRRRFGDTPTGVRGVAQKSNGSV